MRNDLNVQHMNALLTSGYQNARREILNTLTSNPGKLPEILFITSFPPRECGIATYSQDLLKSLNNKFNQSFELQVCALESNNESHIYTNDVKITLNTDNPDSFTKTASLINNNASLCLVVIQHEFGFFADRESDFNVFLESINKPIVIVFHTVLPFPDERLKRKVQRISAACKSIIVMTHSSKEILVKEYDIQLDKITVIPHGTHLVPHANKRILKKKYNIADKVILSTFGLLSSGKSIETTLLALPDIIKVNANVLFLIIGKTHPSVVKREEEKYRQMLEAKVVELHLENNVQFINRFLPLPDLLEYLQLTDIYLFTSRDPHQAVSGTFSYAISCGCPVISTPIPHAREVLSNEAGIIIDFENPKQLSAAVNTLLGNEEMRRNLSSNGLHKIASTAWENSAVAHALLFVKTENNKITLQYNLPPINLDHIRKMTTDFGMIQFSNINKPDIHSGYTLDDNARALIAMCQHYQLSSDKTDITYIRIYLHFIKHCFQPEGNFLNYVDQFENFSAQNYITNLADANGRAIWALGYVISMSDRLPTDIIKEAEEIWHEAMQNISEIHSTRAMSFAIKGMYYKNLTKKSGYDQLMIRELANRLVQMYRHEADKDWAWYESYLTYANSILPEALLCAWLVTNEAIYKEIAKTSFDFLISKIINEKSINVISNRTWMHKATEFTPKILGGEQPIDVAYTILALRKFYDVFTDREYLDKMQTAFNWFLGNNHLHQIIYNPCTGGCFDGLEENYVNLNQGAESTVSYLMARLTVEDFFGSKRKDGIGKFIESNQTVNLLSHSM